MSDARKARQEYDAGLRSGWDSYPGAITAAHAGDVSRLVDCLRGCKPLEADDWGRLERFISIKWRRRLWPGWLEDTLRQRPVNPDYARLADEVERIGRRRGGVQDDLVHDTARLVDVILFGRRVSDKLCSLIIALTLVSVCNEACGAQLLRLRLHEEGDTDVVEVASEEEDDRRREATLRPELLLLRQRRRAEIVRELQRVGLSVPAITAELERRNRWVIAGGDPNRTADLLAKVRKLLDHQRARRHNPRARADRR